MNILHLEPYEYAHIKDKSENILFLIEGPCTYVLKSHEEIALNKQKMIILPSNCYITILNPVVISNTTVVYENINGKVSKLAKLKFGEEEVRYSNDYQDPFPLFPGEIILKDITIANVIGENEALKLLANRDFYDKINNKHRSVGDEWILPGPIVYIDQIEITVIKVIKAEIITLNTALRVVAKKDYVDRTQVKRITGEEWLIRKEGSYIPSAEEEIVKLEKAIILSNMIGIIIEASSSFADIYGVNRRPGETWLLTSKETSIHIIDVNERLKSIINRTVLSKDDYCYIKNPYNDKLKKNEYGKVIVKTGEDSFFLKPDEVLLEGTIFKKRVLSKDLALLVLCNQEFTDENQVIRRPGERWLVKGPCSYVPPVEVKILEDRERICLNDSEGIYIRDIHTGSIKMITGRSYLLEAHEELWDKDLSNEMMVLLQNEGIFHVDNQPKLIKSMKKSSVIAFTVPHNSVSQVFDYKEKQSKIVFGPELVKLGPYEQFTILEFSGDNPKTEKKIKTLIMRLGPDYISDTIEVETSDHAKLLLRITYSWEFVFDKTKEDEVQRLFHVKDFVGDCCKSVASRIRGIVSSVSFDDFHRESSNIVQIGVFGKDSQGKLKRPLVFKSNNLHITNVDIQSQEPVDKKTREILNDSMKLSMETNIKIKEAEAVHIENRANQEANGKVKRKEIEDETVAEEKRLVLLELEAENKSINIIGRTEAVSKAEAEEKEINSISDLTTAKIELEEERIKRKSELSKKEKIYLNEIEHLKRMKDLEIEKAEKLSSSEVMKIEKMVEAIGKETLIELSRAGPETQAKILKSLGVKSLLITDGKSPINLFNTSNGMMGLGNSTYIKN